MKIATRLVLPRYIIREHVGPFVFSSAVITLIFLLNLAFRELSRLLSKGLPFRVVVEFFALNMAWIVALSAPMAVLTATLMAFGRLSADNEITAMKATGVSLYRIILPVLIVATLLAAGLVWFNNDVLPDMNHRTRLLAADIARKRPSVSLEAGVWFDDLANYGILVQSLEDSGRVTKAREILIADHTNLDVIKTLSARRGAISLDPASGALVLLLFDGEMQEINIRKPEEFHRLVFPRHMVSIPARDMFLQRSASDYRGDREKSATQMRQEVAVQQTEIARLREEINRLVGTELYSVFDTTFGLCPPGRAPAPDAASFPWAGKITAQQSSRAMVTASPYDHNRSLSGGGRPETTARPEGGRTTISSLRTAQRLLLQNIESNLASIDSNHRTINSLLVEIHKKYSIPVACLVFVLIGVPLGVLTRRRGLAVSGGISLGFFLLYWSCLIAGEDLADRQMLSPFVAMWLANIVVGALGLHLLIAVAQERGLSVPQNIRRIVSAPMRWARRKHRAPQAADISC